MNSSRAAEDILRHVQACYQPTHRYVSVNLRDFRHVDQRFYAETQRFLEKEGFAHLTDEEDETLRDAPGSVLRRVPVRVMISREGHVSAGFYHPRAKFWSSILLFLMRAKLGRTIDFETEYSDGSFIVTSNAESAAAMHSPPMVHTEYFPVATKVDYLLERHRLKMKVYGEVNPDVRPCLIRSVEEMRASQNRLNAVKAAFREEIGDVTLEELERAAGKHVQIAAEIHGRIREIQARGG